jgi:hypothetical protein
LEEALKGLVKILRPQLLVSPIPKDNAKNYNFCFFLLKGIPMISVDGKNH